VLNTTTPAIEMSGNQIFDSFLTCCEEWLEENAPSLPISEGLHPYGAHLDLVGLVLNDVRESADPEARLVEHLEHIRATLPVLLSLLNGLMAFEAGALSISDALNERLAQSLQN
jgi:hypothetical protein